MASRAACERPRHGSLGSLASSFPGETLSLQRCVTLQRLLACARAWYQSSAISVTFRTLCRDPRGDLRKVPREGTFKTTFKPLKQRCGRVTVVRREAPAPVPEVRTGGLYRGAPCTVGTKDRLHRSLCAPSVFSKSRTLLANMTKMSEAYPQTLKNSCYNNVCAWHLRPKGHLTYQRSHFDYILTVLRPFS